MKSISSYEQLEALGRERLSKNFFMREFLHSEIAAWHGMRNVPDRPEVALEMGRKLCEELLEPLQAVFGKIHVRSGYRSPEVNMFGNRNGLNCASNELNRAGHIWDLPDAEGFHGATACIVVPWLTDRLADGGSWTEMAWWIHDHLPYSSLRFFAKQGAFNINWHERPARRIDSYVSPKGCLTCEGMSNHAGDHSEFYLAAPPSPMPKLEFSVTSREVGKTDHFLASVQADTKAKTRVGFEQLQANTGESQQILYRAVHTKNVWRKVHSHRTLESAISGKDGAAGLFAGKVRIDYAKHGDPLFVLVWQAEAPIAYVIRRDAVSPNGIAVATLPAPDFLRFDANNGASHKELAAYFSSL